MLIFTLKEPQGKKKEYMFLLKRLRADKLFDYYVESNS